MKGLLTCIGLCFLIPVIASALWLLWPKISNTVEDVVEQVQDQKEDNDFKDLLSNLTGKAHSDDTQKAMDKYTSATSKATALNEKWDSFDVKWPILHLPTYFKRRSANVDEATAKNDLELAVANDTVYQSALGLESSENKQELQNTIKQYMPIILAVLGVLALLLIVGLVATSRKGSGQAAPVIVPTPVAQPAVTSVNTTGDVAVNYDRLLASNCKKLGLSVDEQLAKYGGNVRLAAEQTQLML